jgi:ribosomal-protein-alanine N-acetyltransferase
MFGEAMQSLIGRMQRPSEMATPADHFEIRALTSDDAGAVADLESRCVGAAQWGKAACRDIAANGIIGLAAARENILLGFILVRAVDDEMEVMNLAVEPGARRQGIAARLLARVIEDVEVNRVYLEVRESNSAARAFYSSRGFAERGRRKNYYSQPVEDALVLVLVLH